MDAGLITSPALYREALPGEAPPGETRGAGPGGWVRMTDDEFAALRGRYEAEAAARTADEVPQNVTKVWAVGCI